MEKSDLNNSNPVINAGSIAPNTPAEQTLSAPTATDEKISRTTGLRIFDVFLYPILTNFVVFVVSVAATYLTSKGGLKNAKGELVYGKVGEWFQTRGDLLKGALVKNIGMTENQADMSKMVAFSFIDGSIMAPVIKWFEDRREKIGRAIDERLGTCPEDDAAYAAEPKQSWLSVLGGRLATVSIVVPTAVVLEKAGLNNIFFTKPGKALGEYLAKIPAIAKRMGSLDVPELGKIGLFEAFYTSVCTAGIYFSSRLIAGFQGKKEEKITTSSHLTSPLPAGIPIISGSAKPLVGKTYENLGIHTARINAESAAAPLLSA